MPPVFPVPGGNIDLSPSKDAFVALADKIHEWEASALPYLAGFLGIILVFALIWFGYRFIRWALERQDLGPMPWEE